MSYTYDPSGFSPFQALPPPYPGDGASSSLSRDSSGVGGDGSYGQGSTATGSGSGSGTGTGTGVGWKWDAACGSGKGEPSIFDTYSAPTTSLATGDRFSQLLEAKLGLDQQQSQVYPVSESGSGAYQGPGGPYVPPAGLYAGPFGTVPPPSPLPLPLGQSNGNYLPYSYDNHIPRLPAQSAYPSAPIPINPAYTYPTQLQSSSSSSTLSHVYSQPQLQPQPQSQSTENTDGSLNSAMDPAAVEAALRDYSQVWIQPDLVAPAVPNWAPVPVPATTTVTAPAQTQTQTHTHAHGHNNQPIPYSAGSSASGTYNNAASEPSSWHSGYQASRVSGALASPSVTATQTHTVTNTYTYSYGTQPIPTSQPLSTSSLPSSTMGASSNQLYPAMSTSPTATFAAIPPHITTPYWAPAHTQSASAPPTPRISTTPPASIGMSAAQSAQSNQSRVQSKYLSPSQPIPAPLAPRKRQSTFSGSGETYPAVHGAGSSPPSYFPNPVAWATTPAPMFGPVQSGVPNIDSVVWGQAPTATTATAHSSTLDAGATQFISGYPTSQPYLSGYSSMPVDRPVPAAYSASTSQPSPATAIPSSFPPIPATKRSRDAAAALPTSGSSTSVAMSASTSTSTSTTLARSSSSQSPIALVDNKGETRAVKRAKLEGISVLIKPAPDAKDECNPGGANFDVQGSSSEWTTLSPERAGSQDKKPVIACHMCRSRKLKCDGARPRCHHCSRRDDEPCVYDAVLKRRGPGRCNKGKGSKRRQRAAVKVEVEVELEAKSEGAAGGGTGEMETDMDGETDADAEMGGAVSGSSSSLGASSSRIECTA